MGDKETHAAGNTLAASYRFYTVFRAEAIRQEMPLETAFKIFDDTREVYAGIDQGVGASKPHLFSETPMEQDANPPQALQQGNQNPKGGKGKPRGTVGTTRSVAFTMQQEDNICRLVLAARERAANGGNSGVGYKKNDGYNEVANAIGSNRTRIKRVCERHGLAYQTEPPTGAEMTDSSAAPPVAASTAASAAASAASSQGTDPIIASDRQAVEMLLHFHTAGTGRSASS